MCGFNNNNNNNDNNNDDDDDDNNNNDKNNNDNNNLYIKMVTQSNGKDLPSSMFTSSLRAPGLQSSTVQCF